MNYKLPKYPKANTRGDLTKWKRKQTVLMGFDGTGAMFNDTYAENFQQSNVNKIIYQSRHNNKFYERGPWNAGYTSGQLTNHAIMAMFIGRYIKPIRILLTGYSRGGVAAVNFAKLLKKYGQNVNAILLFDPVDRDIHIDSEKIPSNVRKVHSVIRHKDTKSRTSFDYEFGKSSMANSANYTEKAYHGTHGAIGGVPWKPKKNTSLDTKITEGFWGTQTEVTYKQEAQAAKDVWEDVKVFMRANNY